MLIKSMLIKRKVCISAISGCELGDNDNKGNTVNVSRVSPELKI